MNRSPLRVALRHAVLGVALALFAVPASAQTVSADGYISLPGGPVETLSFPRFTDDERDAELLRDDGLVFIVGRGSVLPPTARGGAEDGSVVAGWRASMERALTEPGDLTVSARTLPSARA